MESNEFNNTEHGPVITGYAEGTFAEGYAKGTADERERIALALKKVDDTWGMLFLSDLFDNTTADSPQNQNEPLRYGED